MMFKPRQKGSSIKNLLKLKDGESFTGVFQGEPRTFFQHWSDGHSAPCTRNEEGGCDACKAGDKGSFRFRVNLVAFTDGAWGARVFEGGGMVYDQLVGLAKEYDLAVTKVRISRTGSKMNDTRYTIMPTKDSVLPAEVLASIARVQLNPLGDGAAIDASDEPAADDAWDNGVGL